MSYRKKHVKNKVHGVKPKKSLFRGMGFWIVFMLLVLVLSAFYFFLFYAGVQVKSVIISGNQKIAAADIENLVSRNINDKVLSIAGFEVNSKSIFFVNSGKLRKEILDKFPQIESAAISKEYMQTLDVKITERVPAAIFCSSNECYFMDDNGVIFEPLYVMPQNMVIVRQAAGSGQIFIGEKVVQQNTMDFLEKVIKDLKSNFQISLNEALVASSLSLDASTNENWHIYFDLSADSDVDSQIVRLNLLLNSGLPPGERKNLRYIDLRPKNRAIVCDNKTCAR